MRVSMEEDANERESNSITNQRLLIREYLNRYYQPKQENRPIQNQRPKQENRPIQNQQSKQENRPIQNQRPKQEERPIQNQRLKQEERTNQKEEESREYVDDGYSGMNMERPGVKRLLLDMKEGKINCILVKDLSRFLRDYIEMGTFLYYIFPQYHVRFIAINDGYDSALQKNVLPLETAFQTLLNDLYSREISEKVKQVIEYSCMQGKYVFGQVPFGYEKMESAKGGVSIQEAEACVVRRIFQLAEQGSTPKEIAAIFSKEQLPTMQQMRTAHNPNDQMAIWSGNAIRKVLTNRFYIGELHYGKTKRVHVGSKKGIAIPKEQWKVCKEHHVPIITEQQFFRIPYNQ